MNNPDLSLRFYRYICDVIGTEEVVKTRRQIFAAYDNVYKIGGIKTIMSGSKAEGLDIDGSDIDIMVLQTNIRVYEKYDQVRWKKCCFVMDTTDCKPGFTQLKLAVPHNCKNLKKYLEYRAGDYFLSSKKFREHFTSKDFAITHGPCKSSVDGEYDKARCFKCDDWISQAQSWLLRTGNQWASQHVIDTIVDFGVLFVPVVSKTSPNVDLEWRVSFSFAEKLLICSFNHIQFLCYALLKILLKEVIKLSTGDLLCSYFLKTIMFWICEETNSYQWKPENILVCFLSCLQRLVYCVRYKTCLHYFIPENDLFENRFDRQQHTLLLSVLDQLRNLGWTCFLQTKTLRSFASFINSNLSPVVYCGSYLSVLKPIEDLVQFGCVGKVKNMSVHHCKVSEHNRFTAYIFSLYYQALGQSFQKGEQKLDNNKQIYKAYRKRLCHLLIGLNTDSVSGWLFLASFFYVNKQYSVSLMILSDWLLRCTPDKYILEKNPTTETKAYFELFRRFLNIDSYSFIKKHTVRPIIFYGHSPILPKEIGDVVEHRPDCQPDTYHLVVPTVVYGLFLKYLCYYSLCNHREKIQSLNELEVAFDSRYFISDVDQLTLARGLLYITYEML